jgi:murein DD-endopeptidase MepM/ murein hydrolase activator NlpD
MFAALLEENWWRRAVSEGGLYVTYYDLFGYSFDYAVEPLLPPDLAQPEFRLPFEDGVAWVFTGGPHGGWDNGSAWAALDFAPASNEPGCNLSDEWVVAMADGPIVRVGDGAVVQDLDGDGLEQTGWTIFYMHIETRDRVRVGDTLNAGDKVGHPSCEGGYSTGTHVHIARKYNGEWIPADGPLPVVMDGWVSHGGAYLYDGYLQKGDTVVEPCECREPEHMITP